MPHRPAPRSGGPRSRPPAGSSFGSRFQRLLALGVLASLLPTSLASLAPAAAGVPPGPVLSPGAPRGAGELPATGATGQLPSPAPVPSPAPSPAPPPASSPRSTSPEPPAAGPRPYSSAEFQKLLHHGSLEQLEEACQRVYATDQLDRLRQIRERLLLILPAPQPLPVVLANAEVLISCRQPQAALTVLDRISPAAGAERLQWLLLEWRAAHAAMDHRRAALALERLSAARPARLEALALPVLRREDGSVVSRPALDLLADHLLARGFPRAAAELLIASQEPGALGAQRRLQAVGLLQDLPVEEREALLETALDQAAAVGAWGLVAELLDAQAALPSDRARQRRLRLSPRIDDAYGEWLILRQDPDAAARSAELEGRLRSPRAKGGHSEDPAPASPAVPAVMPTPSSTPAPPSPASQPSTPRSLAPQP